MTDAEKVAHLDSVALRVRRLPSPLSRAFGLACIDAMLPVYTKAAAGRDWDRSQLLATTIDDAWRKVPTPGTSDSCRLAIPSDDQLTDYETVAAFMIANAVADFLAEVESGRSQYAHFMAARAIELTEMLEESKGERIGASSLLRSEVVRQNTLLNRLESSEALEPLAFRADDSHSLFEHEWFA